VLSHHRDFQIVIVDLLNCATVVLSKLLITRNSNTSGCGRCRTSRCLLVSFGFCFKAERLEQMPRIRRRQNNPHKTQLSQLGSERVRLVASQITKHSTSSPSDHHAKPISTNTSQESSNFPVHEATATLLHPCATSNWFHTNGYRYHEEERDSANQVIE
jgi:hypothetical protein